MKAEGVLFMSRTRPLAGPAADNTFQLTLLAMDRVRTNQVEPWRVTWSGNEAREFWERHGSELTPGQPLRITARNLKGFSARHCAPEIHAHVERIELAPRSTERTAAQPQTSEA